ncbi:MAG TPA: hypothetical protein VFF10_09150, partial [Trueperaceae bacterium]|nr:hypothetical protein [Trueperaceae bacterium]
MRRVRIWLAGALLALLIAACGAPQPPAETALISDADLVSAVMAPTAALDALVGSATDLDLAVDDVPNRETLAGHSDFASSVARSG